MKLDLENAIKNNSQSMQDGLTKSHIELSNDSVLKLLKWYDGNIFNQSVERIRNAIDVLTWCYYESNDVDLYPSELRNGYLDKISEKFNISREKLTNLILSYNRMFNNLGKNTTIIAFEGIDGSGKSVQIGTLAKKLEDLGYKVGIKSFPIYDSFFGVELGKLLSGNNSIRADVVDSKSMCLWYALDRWKAFQSFKYQEYDFLLLNRFTLSSAVYQSIRVSEDEQNDLISWIFELEHTQLSLPVPDLYLIFDLNPQMSMQNVLNKGHREYVGEKPDVYEGSLDLIQNARAQYLKMASKMSNIEIINCIEHDNKMKTPEEISTIIFEVLSKCKTLNTTP